LFDDYSDRLLDYNRFPFNERKDEFFDPLDPSKPLIISGDPATIITISGNLKWWTGSEVVNVFLTGGVGYLIESVRYGSISSGLDLGGEPRVIGESQSAILLSLGCGIGVPISENLMILGELKFVIGFTDEDCTAFFPLKIGLGYNL
jgi:hypothetical protein